MPRLGPQASELDALHVVGGILETQAVEERNDLVELGSRDVKLCQTRQEPGVVLSMAHRDQGLDLPRPVGRPTGNQKELRQCHHGLHRERGRDTGRLQVFGRIGQLSTRKCDLAQPEQRTRMRWQLLHDELKLSARLVHLASPEPSQSPLGANVEVVGCPPESCIGDSLGKLELLGVRERPGQSEADQSIERPGHIRHPCEHSDHSIPVASVRSNQCLPHLRHHGRHTFQRATHVFGPAASCCRAKGANLLKWG